MKSLVDAACWNDPLTILTGHRSDLVVYSPFEPTRASGGDVEDQPDGVADL